MITKFFKELFSTPYSLLLIPIIFIIYVAFSSMDDIKGRLGFETKTSLKSELTSTKKDLALSQATNKQLESQLAKAHMACHMKEEANQAINDSNASIDKLISDAIENSKKFKAEEPTAKKEIMSDVEEIEKTESNLEETESKTAAHYNISALHDMYNQLFGS